MKLMHVLTGIKGEFLKEFYSPLGFIGYQIKTDDGRIYYAPRGEFRILKE